MIYKMSRNYCSNEHFHKTLGSEIVFRKNYRMLPSPPCLALCLHAHEHPHHSIGDREGAAGIAGKGCGRGMDNHTAIRSAVAGSKSPSYVRTKRRTLSSSSLWEDARRLGRAKARAMSNMAHPMCNLSLPDRHINNVR